MLKDLDRLQGSWSVAALEMDGEPAPAAALQEARIVIKGDRFTSLGMSAVYEGKMTLDASASPARVDMVFDSGPEKGNTNRGIYRLDGDTWKLCLATRGTARPRSFVSKPGTGIALETLVRGNVLPVSTKARSRAVKKPAGPVTEFEGEWTMVSGVMDGKAMDASMVQWVKRVTQGNLTTVTAGPQTMLKVEFEFDASKSPATIDYANTDQRGIYKFENGVLTVCVARPGAARPAKFESVRGDGRSLTVWRRVG